MSLLSVCVIQAHPRRSTGQNRVKQERTVIAPEVASQSEPEFYTEHCELVHYSNNFSRDEIVRVPAPRPHQPTCKERCYFALACVAGAAVGAILPWIEFKVCGGNGCPTPFGAL